MILGRPGGFTLAASKQMVGGMTLVFTHESLHSFTHSVDITAKGARFCANNDESCTENDELCNENDESCTENDEFCTDNDGFCTEM